MLGRKKTENEFLLVVYSTSKSENFFLSCVFSVLCVLTLCPHFVIPPRVSETCALLDSELHLYQGFAENDIFVSVPVSHSSPNSHKYPPPTPLHPLPPPPHCKHTHTFESRTVITHVIGGNAAAGSVRRARRHSVSTAAWPCEGNWLFLVAGETWCCALS